MQPGERVKWIPEGKSLPRMGRVIAADTVTTSVFADCGDIEFVDTELLEGVDETPIGIQSQVERHFLNKQIVSVDRTTSKSWLFVMSDKSRFRIEIAPEGIVLLGTQ